MQAFKDFDHAQRKSKKNKYDCQAQKVHKYCLPGEHSYCAVMLVKKASNLPVKMSKKCQELNDSNKSSILELFEIDTNKLCDRGLNLGQIEMGRWWDWSRRSNDEIRGAYWNEGHRSPCKPAHPLLYPDFCSLRPAIHSSLQHWTSSGTPCDR